MCINELTYSNGNSNCATFPPLSGSFKSNLLTWAHYISTRWITCPTDLIDLIFLFNAAIFSNISAISWRPVLLVEEAVVS